MDIKQEVEFINKHSRFIHNTTMEILELDKQQELLNDVIDHEVMSLCCSAAMIGDICMDCKEHSGPAPEE